jgi:3-hydroxybutyryl-CoA dehydrogenase
MIQTIIICGAGTMGTGIAQISAQSGFYTMLYDLNPAMLEKAKISIAQSLEKLIEKGKINLGEKDQILLRLKFTDNLFDCIGDLIIEAIAEKLEYKIALFNQLAEINHSDTIFATNTSSLSVTAIASGTMHPGRVCGLHFFNPAPVMKLVEVIRAEQSREDVIEIVTNFARQLGKITVLCKDAPGFIVNRVARHYYLEPLALVEKGFCTIETADDLLESCGFKMGPFKLMDLIGNDVNYAVTESLYEACGQPVRFRPSPLQKEKVEKGAMGRKTGSGFYIYDTHIKE